MFLFFFKLFLTRFRRVAGGVGHAYQVTDDIVQFTRVEGRAVVGGHQRLRTVFQSLEIRLRDKVKSAVQSLQLERKIVFVANYAHIFLTAPTGRRHRSRLMIAVRRGVGDRLADLLHRMSASVRLQIRSDETTFARNLVAGGTSRFCTEDRLPPPWVPRELF